MYEEITRLENDLAKVLDKYKEVPLAVRVGTLFNVITIIQLHTQPIQDIIVPAETLPVTTEIPDDGGPAMTIVEKNLESG